MMQWIALEVFWRLRGVPDWTEQRCFKARFRVKSISGNYLIVKWHTPSIGDHKVIELGDRMFVAARSGGTTPSWTVGSIQTRPNDLELQIRFMEEISTTGSPRPKRGDLLKIPRNSRPDVSWKDIVIIPSGWAMRTLFRADEIEQMPKI